MGLIPTGATTHPGFPHLSYWVLVSFRNVVEHWAFNVFLAGIQNGQFPVWYFEFICYNLNIWYFCWPKSWLNECRKVTNLTIACMNNKTEEVAALVERCDDDDKVDNVDPVIYIRTFVSIIFSWMSGSVLGAVWAAQRRLAGGIVTREGLNLVDSGQQQQQPLYACMETLICRSSSVRISPVSQIASALLLHQPPFCGLGVWSCGCLSLSHC